MKERVLPLLDTTIPPGNPRFVRNGELRLYNNKLYLYIGQNDNIYVEQAISEGKYIPVGAETQLVSDPISASDALLAQNNSELVPGMLYVIEELQRTEFGTIVNVGYFHAIAPNQLSTDGWLLWQQRPGDDPKLFSVTYDLKNDVITRIYDQATDNEVTASIEYLTAINYDYTVNPLKGDLAKRRLALAGFPFNEPAVFGNRLRNSYMELNVIGVAPTIVNNSLSASYMVVPENSSMFISQNELSLSTMDMTNMGGIYIITGNTITNSTLGLQNLTRVGTDTISWNIITNSTLSMSSNTSRSVNLFANTINTASISIPIGSSFPFGFVGCLANGTTTTTTLNIADGTNITACEFIGTSATITSFAMIDVHLFNLGSIGTWGAFATSAFITPNSSSLVVNYGAVSGNVSIPLANGLQYVGELRFTGITGNITDLKVSGIPTGRKYIITIDPASAFTVTIPGVLKDNVAPGEFTPILGVVLSSHTVSGGGVWGDAMEVLSRENNINLITSST